MTTYCDTHGCPGGLDGVCEHNVGVFDQSDDCCPAPHSGEPARAEALRGPWVAVLADGDGFVYDSVDDARENAEDPEDQFTVTVVRGSAAPSDRDGTTGINLRLPGTFMAGDVAYVLDDVYLDDPDDPSVGADARLAQALAMAAGLNAAASVDASGGTR